MMKGGMNKMEIRKWDIPDPEEMNDGKKRGWSFRLYIVGSGPNSVRAQANLDALLKEFLDEDCQLETIDIFQDPKRAFDDNILLTPTLIKLFPPPRVKVVGNLSDREQVILLLGLR